MKAEWLTVDHSTNVKDWFKKWFYANQNLQGRRVPNDIWSIPERNPRWSKEPTSDEMVHVNEITALMDQKNVNGFTVAAAFIRRRIQPLKERMNFLWEYRGAKDPARETDQTIANEDVKLRLARMFKQDGDCRVPLHTPLPFDWRTPPPTLDTSLLLSLFLYCRQ